MDLIEQIDKCKQETAGFKQVADSLLKEVAGLKDEIEGKNVDIEVLKGKLNEILQDSSNDSSSNFQHVQKQS